MATLSVVNARTELCQLVSAFRAHTSETYELRRAVSADGRTDLPSMRHELDALPGAWHIGAVDGDGRVVAISSYFPVPSPIHPDAQPAWQLQFMAVAPPVQRKRIWTAILTKA